VLEKVNFPSSLHAGRNESAVRISPYTMKLRTIKLDNIFGMALEERKRI
jgi:hypothetical protein